MTTSRAIKGTRESEVGRVILVSRASEGLHLLSGTVCALTHIMIVQVALDRGLSDEAFAGEASTKSKTAIHLWSSGREAKGTKSGSVTRVIDQPRL